MKRPIYMDNAATTRVDPRVVDAMLPYFTESYGNASSRNHAFGWEAEEAVEVARRRLASLLGCEPRELTFVSGATESINLALKGVTAAYASKGRHVVTTAIEHPAVLDSTKSLEKEGVEVTYLPVDAEGRVAMDRLEAALRPDTVLVSVILGNNETGVVQSVSAIGDLCRSKEVLFHTDATQAVGKMPVDVAELSCDLLSCSAHKFHGPKGVGVLFSKRRSPRVRLRPLIDGGGHESGVRSGTLPVPAIVGMGRAAELARVAVEEGEPARIAALRDELETRLLQLPGVVRNTPPDGRLPHILNVSFQELEGESLLLGLRDVAVSSGSACASASLDPSHVLIALGRKPELARSALRLSLSRFTTEEEVEAVAESVAATVTELRRLRRQHHS